MEHAIAVTAALDTITVPALVDVHRVLMEKTRDAHLAGTALVRLARAARSRRGCQGAQDDRPTDWYLDFALTVIRACRAARQLSQKIDDLESHWLEQAGNPRRNSTARKIIQLLPGQPILRVSNAVTLTGASTSSAHQAVNDLERAGVLKQVTVGRRNRAWEAVGLLRLIDDFERRLATPEGDDGRPARPAPAVP